MRILKFDDYTHNDDILDYFINSLQHLGINESQNNEYESILSKLKNDLKLNLDSITKFGTTITAFYPIVGKLISNMQLKVENPIEASVLLTICAISILYSEDKKVNENDRLKMKNQCRSMLEELKLRGIGNGIVKKIIACFGSIFKLFKTIGKHLGSVVVSFFDMFAFTALLLPVLNSIIACIGKYSLNIDTLQGNLLSIGVGVGTIVVKNIITDTLKKLNKPDKKKEIINDIDAEQNIKKFGDAEFSKDLSKEIEPINEKD